MTIDEKLALLTSGCVDVVRVEELRAKLERSERTSRPLVVKVGFDPTAPDLHLGHTVLIRKMKQFQDLGHRVVYVVGDFTGLIGDPTGRSKTRPPLTREEIERNAETYKSQIFKLLEPGKTVIEFNSRWLRELGAEGWIRLAAQYSVARMLERRDFRHRYESGQPIGIHEFLYPLAQAYDSVALEADFELGGTDQLFNLNVGRDIMPAFGLEPQVVMTTPLLEGLDGVEKMSKSLGNYVGVTDEPVEMFGKVMSISDQLMWRYYELLTDFSADQVRELRRQVDEGMRHPKRAKMDLARMIVAWLHDEAAAEGAEVEFERVFGGGGLPADLQTVREPLSGTPVQLPRWITDLGLAVSASEARRLVVQGAVALDGEVVRDPNAVVERSRPRGVVVRVGKRRFLRVEFG
jgi:tyrosyl-tRNA synthetase